MPYSPFENRLGDERLRGLYRYWRLVRGRRFAPGRADIDPRDIPTLLPVLALIDVVGSRFRFRLAGDEVTEQFGRGLIGKSPEELVRGEARDRLLMLFNLVLERRRPGFWDGPHKAGEAGGGRLSRFAAPVSGDGKRVTMLLAGQVAYFGESGPELLIAEQPGGLSEAVRLKQPAGVP